MEDIINELETDICDCILDAGDGGDNKDYVDDALLTLEKLRKKLGITKS